MSLATEHMVDLGTTLLQYRDEEFLCDTVILTGNKKIKAHSVLLAACSSVFHDAFATAETTSGMYQVSVVLFYLG